MPSDKEVLKKDGSVSVHHRSIQSFSIQILQIKHDQASEIVTNILTQTTQLYHFKQNWDFRMRSVDIMVIMTIMIMKRYPI